MLALLRTFLSDDAVLPPARVRERSEESVLIDVRTQAEWGFVGVPDLAEVGRSTILVEWAGFPGMSRNPRFVTQVIERRIIAGGMHVAAAAAAAATIRPATSCHRR